MGALILEDCVAGGGGSAVDIPSMFQEDLEQLLGAGISGGKFG